MKSNVSTSSSHAGQSVPAGDSVVCVVNESEPGLSMISSYAEYVGYLAAVLGTICWIPQTWKTWRTRETKDLSLWANSLILATVSCWLLYGLMIGSLPLIVGNTISILAVGAIVIAELIYR